MKTSRKIAIVASILGIMIVLLGSLKIHFVREDSGGDLLWSSSEAYLFMNVSRRGFQVSYLEYPWMLVREHLRGVRSMDNQCTSITVVHITASGVESHVVEMLDEEPGNTPVSYTPFQGYIYANCEGSLCKWSGDKFASATEEEQRRLNQAHQNPLKDANRDAGAWSERGFGEASSDYQFGVDVGQTFKLEITNKQLDPAGHSTVSVQIVRPAQAPEGIWHFNGMPRRVSKTEYEQAFKRP